MTEPVHEQNNELGWDCDLMAEAKGYQVKHHASGALYGEFDGYHRWVVSPQGSGDPACNGRSVVYYSEARFSKCYRPSIIGEKTAIEAVLAWLREAPKIEPLVEVV